MNVPILIESHEGQFAASLVGTSKVKAVEQSRSLAISSLRNKIHQSIKSGELLFLDIDATGLSNIVGKYESDPTLRDICNEAYKKRDEDRSR